MEISVRQKNVIYSQPFLKIREILLDMRKKFLIMSNFYLAEILSEPNSLTIVTSKKLLKNEQLCTHFEYFFLIMRIRNVQCNTPAITYLITRPKNKALFCSESSHVNQCTSGDLISREENHIHPNTPTPFQLHSSYRDYCP